MRRRSAEAGVTVSVLTIRGRCRLRLWIRMRTGSVFAFGAEAGDGVADPLVFAYVEGGAGLTVLVRRGRYVNGAGGGGVRR